MLENFASNNKKNSNKNLVNIFSNQNTSGFFTGINLSVYSYSDIITRFSKRE